jgi:hypothetical protein
LWRFVNLIPYQRNRDKCTDTSQPKEQPQAEGRIRLSAYI